MPQARWLFVREGRSIFVERERGHAMVVNGPGPYGMRHEFRSEEELHTFQTEMVERLASRGWSLRAVDYDRRNGHDRRREGRATSEDRRRSSTKAVPGGDLRPRGT